MISDRSIFVFIETDLPAKRNAKDYPCRAKKRISEKRTGTF